MALLQCNEVARPTIPDGDLPFELNRVHGSGQMLQRPRSQGLSCREPYRQSAVDQGARSVSPWLSQRIDVVDAYSAIGIDLGRSVDSSKFDPSLPDGAVTRGKPEMYSIQLRGCVHGPFKRYHGLMDGDRPGHGFDHSGKWRGQSSSRIPAKHLLSDNKTKPCVHVAGLCSEGGTKVRRRQQGC